jgi:hypothetical protein
MELKENYTREEADFMSIMSSIIGRNPHTFQGNLAYWDLVEVDFENKVVNFTVFTKDEPHNLYYLVAGVASVHGYEFDEEFPI